MESVECVFVCFYICCGLLCCGLGFVTFQRLWGLTPLCQTIALHHRFRALHHLRKFPLHTHAVGRKSECAGYLNGSVGFDSSFDSSLGLRSVSRIGFGGLAGRIGSSFGGEFGKGTSGRPSQSTLTDARLLEIHERARRKEKLSHIARSYGLDRAIIAYALRPSPAMRRALATQRAMAA